MTYFYRTHPKFSFYLWLSILINFYIITLDILLVNDDFNADVFGLYSFGKLFMSFRTNIFGALEDGLNALLMVEVSMKLKFY